MAICDTDTICVRFDEKLLCSLYREYVNISLPRNYSLRQLATHVKDVAQKIVEAESELDSIGIAGVDDILQILEKYGVVELCKHYSECTLRACIFVYISTDHYRKIGSMHMPRLWCSMPILWLEQRSYLVDYLQM